VITQAGVILVKEIIGVPPSGYSTLFNALANVLADEMGMYCQKSYSSHTYTLLAWENNSGHNYKVPWVCYMDVLDI